MAMTLSAIALGAAASGADEKKPSLSVRLTALTPTVLKKGADVTMRGTVTNNNDFTWDNVQAYLVIPRSPFTSRAQVNDAKTHSNSYTGERVVEIDSFDNVGDLASGSTRTFTVKVPYEQLGITGADGVYPVGIQILATGEDGIRSNDAVARATTFIPLLHDPPKAQIPTAVAWPFLMPTYRGPDGTYARLDELVRAVNNGGRLRNMLGVAASSPADTGTVIIDPALLVAVDEIARGKRVDPDTPLTADEKLGAEKFVTDLAALARRDRCWVVDYDRPDLLALNRDSDIGSPLKASVASATRGALADFNISCRGVSWPRAGSATASLVKDVRGAGDQPIIVAADNLVGWDRREGSLVNVGTPAGPVPLLVDDALDESVPGEDSVVTLRQRIASESALAVLQRAIDPESAADAITLVDPRWDPGAAWEEGRFNDALTVPWVAAAGLDSMLTRPIGTFDGSIEPDPDSTPLGADLLRRATKLNDTTKLMSSVLLDAGPLRATMTQDVAQAVSGRWRSDQATARASISGAQRRADGTLTKITVKGPPRVTLSSDKGSFPFTISNRTGHRVRVGLRIDSSNPALTIPDIKPVTIDADQRRTVTANVLVGNQGSASVEARLMTQDKATFGEPAVFNVRSSVLGTVIWVGFGVAGALLVLAFGRRFLRMRRSAAPR